MRLAIDAMGGDNAPTAIVEGSCEALKKNASIEKLFLVGDQKQIEPLLPQELRNRIEIIHTNEVIEMNEHPAQAYRKKKNASISVASRLVKDGRADAIISAGSTGAQLVTGLFEIGRIRGIKRPAIAVPLPTLTGVKVLVDAGANTEVDLTNIEQFAIMGSFFASVLRKDKNNIQVALINNGSEETKGNRLTQDAFQVLKNNKEINFYGNIEGSEVLTSDVDVLVCDGFTGNIVLKTCEGAVGAMFNAMKDLINESFRYKMGALLLKPGLKQLKETYNPKTVGGSPLLGIDGVSIVCHGNSDAVAFENGIKIAVDCIENKLVEKIKKCITEE